MTYADWKLETPDDEQLRYEYETKAWERRLYGRPAWWERDPDEARQDRIADIRETCYADWQLCGEDDE